MNVCSPLHETVTNGHVNDNDERLGTNCQKGSRQGHARSQKAKDHLSDRKSDDVELRKGEILFRRFSYSKRNKQICKLIKGCSNP